MKEEAKAPATEVDAPEETKTEAKEATSVGKKSKKRSTMEADAVQPTDAAEEKKEESPKKKKKAKEEKPSEAPEEKKEEAEAPLKKGETLKKKKTKKAAAEGEAEVE